MRRRDDDEEIFGMMEHRALVRVRAEREVALRAVQMEEHLWDSLGYALASVSGLAVAILLGIAGAALMCALAAAAGLGGGVLFVFSRRSHRPPTMTPH
ncbi:hypothetical protein [Streptomyces europaeiscabiei]|uniref:hypothetical protein n=1 Tax=Streptomyces europaeiscabiei TaxID=146819 RepID=UPI002E29A8E4|nr:hypothetical protein [Streptomyces europaeiscabiei]